MKIPYVYLVELLEHRIEGHAQNSVVYVPDDLFDHYDCSTNPRLKYEDVKSPKPNLLFKGRILMPESVRPKPSQPCCCCCCKENR